MVQQEGHGLVRSARSGAKGQGEVRSATPVELADGDRRRLADRDLAVVRSGVNLSDPRECPITLTEQNVDLNVVVRRIHDRQSQVPLPIPVEIRDRIVPSPEVRGIQKVGERDGVRGLISIRQGRERVLGRVDGVCRQ